MTPDTGLTEDHPVLGPSKFWQELNARNAEQLLSFGFENFKQRQAFNYFTWGPSESDQLTALRQGLPRASVLRSLPVYPSWARRWHVPWNLRTRFRYCFFVKLLWEYALLHGDPRVLALREPQLGNPINIDGEGRISQDLANSALEVAAIVGAMEATSLPEPGRILEVGAGYGRTAWALMNRFAHSRYVIVDFPPASTIAETYLSRVFPKKKIFRLRRWEAYADVRDDIESADLVFVLPSQALKLPEAFVELFLTISSLGEMRMDQIQLYFDLASTMTRGVFYTKQWKVSTNVVDNVVIRENDYPVPPAWRKIFSRTAPVQTSFFEAAFATE